MLSLKNAFPNQERDETVYVFVRRHWLAFLPFLGFVIAILLAGVIAILLITNFFADSLNEWAFPVAILSLSMLFLAIATIFLVGWLDFYFDIHVVTDRRIVDIDQKGLFNRVTSELNLSQVEDVTAHSKGFLETFFTFGDVTVQTAGTQPNFVLEKIPKPNEVTRLISELSHQARQGIASAKRRPRGEIQKVINGKIVLSDDHSSSLPPPVPPSTPPPSLPAQPNVPVPPIADITKLEL